MKGMSEVEANVVEAKRIADDIRACNSWLECGELLPQLCELAGLSEEWGTADGEDFESVIYAAADRLGVDISVGSTRRDPEDDYVCVRRSYVDAKRRVRNWYEVRLDQYRAGDISCGGSGMLQVMDEAEAYRIQHLCELDHTAPAGAMRYVSRRSYGEVHRYNRHNTRAWYEADWKVYEPSWMSTSLCRVSYYRTPDGMTLDQPWAECDKYFVAADLVYDAISHEREGDVSVRVWRDFARFLAECEAFCAAVYNRREEFGRHYEAHDSSWDREYRLGICRRAAGLVGLLGFGRYL